MLVVALLPLLFSWRLFVSSNDRLYIAEGDLASQYYPMRAYAASALAKGQVPLWNGYLFGGQPAMADIQMATFYPPQLLWSLAAGGDLTYSALEWQAVLHLTVAAVGMYLLVLRLSRSRIGGMTAAVVYATGGYLTSFPVQQITILSTAAWLPWLLLAVLKLVRSSNGLARPVASAAIIFTLVLLAGHPQTALLVTYATVGFAAWQLATTRDWRFRSLAVIGALVLGAGLGAAQLIPTLEFLAHSTRQGLGYDQVSRGFGLHEVTAALYPGYFGGSPQFAGILALLLAAIAVATVPWRQVSYWAGLGVVGLLLSFGGATFLYPLFYIFVPGFSSSRDQERNVLWLAVALAVLAGLGMAALLRRAQQGAALDASWRRGLWQAAAVAIGFGLLLFAGTRLTPAPGTDVNLFGGMLKQHVWLVLSLGAVALLATWQALGFTSSSTMGIGLLLLLAANLFSVNWRYNLGPAPAAATRPSSDLTGLVARQLEPGYRFASGGLLPEGPSAGLLYGFADTTGNTPLSLASYASFVAHVPEWRRWQLLSVSHVAVAQGTEPTGGLTQVLAGQPAIYRLNQPLPPLRLIHEAVQGSASSAWNMLASPAFDPAREALVPDSQDLGLAAPIAPEWTQAQRWAAGDILVEAQVSAPALAVFSQISYPGWQARVDGRPADLIPCDVLFLGVKLSPGRHTVQLTYRPVSFLVGTAISLVCAASILILAVRREAA